MIAACLPHILGHIQSDLTGHLERCPFGILPLVGRQSTAGGSRGRRFPAKRRPFWGRLCVGKIGFLWIISASAADLSEKKRNFVADVIFRTVRCVNCFSSCWPSRRACSFRRAATVRASGAGALCGLLGGRYAHRRVAVRAYVQFGPEPPTPCAPGGGILPGAAFVPLRRPASSGRTRRRARRRFVGLRYGSCQVNQRVPNLRSLRRTACRGLLCLPARRLII